MKYLGLKSYFLICLINLVIAACMGLVLRSAFVAEPFFNYEYLLHAHSHTAALGWAYQILTVLIYHFFVKDQWKKFKRLFWVTQISVLGMMVSFPIQGYAFFSILFSSLHIICSYIFVFLVWKKASFENKLEKFLIRASLMFLVISTLAIWSLGPVIILVGKDSIFYHLTIQFYLHFQFQGWFIFSLLAFLVRVFRNLFNESICDRWSQYAFVFLTSAVVLNFSLVIFGFYRDYLWYYLNSTGNLFLILSVLLAITVYRKFKPQNFQVQKSDIPVLMKFAVICIAVKIVLQIGAFFPTMAIHAVKMRYFSIGYIHLILLGAVTSFVIGWFQTQNYFAKQVLNQIAIFSFILSVILTSVFLFLQGFLIINGNVLIGEFHSILFLLSTLLLLSLLMIVIAFFYSTFKNHNLIEQ